MLKRSSLTPATVSLWLVGLLAVIPFLVSRHRYPIASFHSEWWAALFGVLALVPVLQRDLWRDFSLPYRIVLPFGLLLLVLLQLNLYPINYPQSHFLFALYLLWAALLMMLGATLRQQVTEERLATVLSVFLLIGTLVSALTGLIQHFHIPTPFNGAIMSKVAPEVYGNLAQHNHFANYSSLGLVAVAWLWLRYPLARWGWIAAALLLLFVIGLSASRTAWFYIAAFIIMAAIYRLRDRENGNRLLAITVFYLAGFVLMQYLGSILSDWAGVASYTIQDKIADRVGGASPRAQLWTVGEEIFLRHPWLGAGVGQFAWQHFLLGDTVGHRVETGVYFTNAHDIVLMLLAELGIFAGLLLVIAALSWLWAYVRQPWTPARLWLLMLLAVEGIHALLEYPMWYTFFLGLTAFWVGYGDPQRFRPRLTVLSRAGLALTLLGGGFILANLMMYERILEDLTAKRYHIASYTLKQREAYLDGLRRVHENSLLTPYVDQLYAGMMEVENKDVSTKVRFMQSVEEFAPTNTVVYEQAALLALDGQQAQAQRQLKLASVSYPRDLPAVQERLLEQAQSEPALAPLAAYATQLLMEKKASVVRAK